MMVLAMFLLVTGAMVSFVGSVMFLVAAFRESALWGLAVIFLPFASLVFLIKYWSDVKRAFLVQLLGMLLGLLGFGTGVATGLGSYGERMPFLEALVSEEDEAGAAWAESPRGGAEPERPDAAEPRSSYVGLTLAEVRERLGAPPRVLTAGGVTTYFYPEVEIVSEDGVTVTAEAVPAR